MGAPTALFPSHAVFGGGWSLGHHVAIRRGQPDGRFLINVLTGAGSGAPITVIQNWAPRK